MTDSVNFRTIILDGVEILIAHKRRGLTPLELLNQLREYGYIDKKIKACILGRLDPMASGMSAFLQGGNCSLMSKYLQNDKTYTFNHAIGFSTDTGDYMGKIVNQSLLDMKTVDMIKYIVNNEFVCTPLTYRQEYPPYSAYPFKINGVTKPLWEWAKLGQLEGHRLPSREVTIYQLQNLGNPKCMLVKDYVQDIILPNLSLISDENTTKFRVDIITQQYKELLSNQEYDDKYILCLPFRVRVSTGTYIRILTSKILEYIRNALDIDTGRSLYSHACNINRENIHF